MSIRLFHGRNGVGLRLTFTKIQKFFEEKEYRLVVLKDPNDPYADVDWEKDTGITRWIAPADASKSRDRNAPSTTDDAHAPRDIGLKNIFCVSSVFRGFTKNPVL
jgi:hypothetical protein